ncbi:MAG: hypothetical protein ABEJ74_00435 [Haloferacaceae archaeon]
MRHFTDGAIGKDVVDRNGEPLGTVTGIEDGNAIIKTETSLEGRMERALAARGPEDDPRLFVTPEMVEETTDEWVRVHVGTA